MPASVVLSGTHVRLEPLDGAHVAGLVAAAGEDRSSYRYTLVPETEAEMRAYVGDALAEQAIGAALPFALVDLRSLRIVGSSRYLDIDYWPDTADGVPSVVEIGATWLAASAQRTPINTEAKLLLLTHAFETWCVHRVSLKTDARNERSRRAIERLGAQFEGVRRAHKPAADGGIRDSALYSLLASEWPDARASLHARLAR